VIRCNNNPTLSLSVLYMCSSLERQSLSFRMIFDITGNYQELLSLILHAQLESRAGAFTHSSFFNQYSCISMQSSSVIILQSITNEHTSYFSRILNFALALQELSSYQLGDKKFRCFTRSFLNLHTLIRLAVLLTTGEMKQLYKDKKMCLKRVSLCVKVRK